MENILTLYKQPYDEKYPVVCMDESSKQHLRETRQKLPMEPVIFSYSLNRYVVGDVLMLRKGGQQETGHCKLKSWSMKIIQMQRKSV